jgi:micrococcal nuclease
MRSPEVTMYRIALVVVVLLVGCRSAPKPLPTGEAVIVKVVDGDTVIVNIDGKEENVRLLGINTPETVKKNWPIECYGPEASKLTKSLLPPGTVVRLERDIEARDAYNRLLAYIYRKDDGLFINLELMRQGDAREMSFKPNTAHATDFHAAATEAEAAGRGLWSACR